ncbi:MAG: NAD(P)/FAD-dependent oxidoreductase [Alicyclobacillus sp.]|nr:NAD(P)/FAD-dependent oxidoreductase [Alicyclobacillus sp.]
MTDKILILGAGYAGMMTASQLERISEPFTIVNKHPYHYFTTLLHEAAGGRATPYNYCVPLSEVLRKPSSQIVVDEVVAIDRERRVVKLKSGEERAFEWLVITLGWIPEYFGIPGLAEHSLVLSNLETAIRIRDHIEGQFKAYLNDGDQRHLHVVVGGAGLTGIELLGELLDWIPELCLKYGIDRQLVDLQNIEAMPTILPQVSETLRKQAADILTQKGAKLRINTKIVQVTEGVVHLEGDETVEAGTIIWTGGVRANPILAEAGFTVDRRGRAKVNEYLQSVDDDHIFIGGDSSWCDDEDGKPLPPTAQVATQAGRILAHNVSAAAHGQPMKPFRAHLLGTLASLGREVGVGDVMGMSVRGMIAGLFKEGSKVKYLWELGGFRLVGDKTSQVMHL